MSLLVPFVWIVAGGLALIHLLRWRYYDALEGTALSIGLGIAALAGVMGLTVLPGRMGWGIIGLFLLIVPIYLYGYFKMVFADMLAEDDPDAPTIPDETDDLPLGHFPNNMRVLAVVLLILVAAHFRLKDLGYSEFQGDEARAVLLAEQMVSSRNPEGILSHKKGPMEVLLPAASIARGDRSEGGARLPFGLAGLAGIMAIFALGSRLWSVRTGFLAASVLALDGYLIAFSRIVQYQSVVFLFSVLAVYCAWRFHREARDAGRYLVLAGLFLGLGSWAHYEMIFALPPVVWLAGSRGIRENWKPKDWIRHLWLPIGVMSVVTFAFYLPFYLHPQFGETFTYIAERRVGGNPPYNMLPDAFLRASFYNASYYVIFLGLGLAAIFAARMRSGWGGGLMPDKFGSRLAGLWLVALAFVVLRPGWFEIGAADAEPRRSLALLVFLPAFALLFTARDADVRWRTILIWLAGPFFAAAFFVKKPHTHFYTMLPAWGLVLGWGLDQAIGMLEARFGEQKGRTLAKVAGAVLLLLFGWHQQVVFLRQTPEYKRVYPEARMPLYWAPFGDELPRGGYFGFPYRSGWNTVQNLYRAGVLQGDYESNEEALITGWYTWGAVRGCEAQAPRHYLVSWRPQDDEDIPEETIENDYHLRAVVTVNGQEKLWIHDREPVEGEPIVIEDGMDVEDLLAAWFGEDEAAVEWHLATYRENRTMAVSQALERPLTISPDSGLSVLASAPIHLLGVDYDTRARQYGVSVADFPSYAAADSPIPIVSPTAGDILGITLVWQVPDSANTVVENENADDASNSEAGTSSSKPIAHNLSAFVHLVREENGETIAQSDGWPDCGRRPSADWDAGEIIFDGHVLEIPAEGLAPGTYSLRAGLYDAETGERMNFVLREDGYSFGSHFPLWDFQVLEESAP